MLFSALCLAIWPFYTACGSDGTARNVSNLPRTVLFEIVIDQPPLPRNDSQQREPECGEEQDILRPNVVERQNNTDAGLIDDPRLLCSW